MKDNKIIAEFMELETETFSSGIVNYYHQDIAEGSFFEEHELSYNVSWDWLMPVVIKIGDKANILGAMSKLRTYSKVRNIEDTYQAVVEFIKTHNLNVSSDNYSLVLATILKRCGSLDNLICELREDADVVYVNIADDIDDVLNEDEVEEIINKIITQEYELR